MPKLRLQEDIPTAPCLVKNIRKKLKFYFLNKEAGKITLCGVKNLKTKETDLEDLLRNGGELMDKQKEETQEKIAERIASKYAVEGTAMYSMLIQAILDGMLEGVRIARTIFNQKASEVSEKKS